MNSHVLSIIMFPMSVDKYQHVVLTPFGVIVYIQFNFCEYLMSIIIVVATGWKFHKKTGRFHTSIILILPWLLS